MVCGIERDRVRHDQGVLGVDGGLHVVTRRDASSDTHEADFRLWILAQLLYSGLHRRWVDGGLLLGIELFHAVQVAAQSVAVADTIAVGDSAELAAVDDDPLAPD